VLKYQKKNISLHSRLKLSIWIRPDCIGTFTSVGSGSLLHPITTQKISIRKNLHCTIYECKKLKKCVLHLVIVKSKKDIRRVYFWQDGNTKKNFNSACGRGAALTFSNIRVYRCVTHSWGIYLCRESPHAGRIPPPHLICPANSVPWIWRENTIEIQRRSSLLKEDCEKRKHAVLVVVLCSMEAQHVL
jgi:hypothetical protein